MPFFNIRFTLYPHAKGAVFSNLELLLILVTRDIASEMFKNYNRKKLFHSFQFIKEMLDKIFISNRLLYFAISWWLTGPGFPGQIYRRFHFLSCGQSKQLFYSNLCCQNNSPIFLTASSRTTTIYFSTPPPLKKIPIQPRLILLKSISVNFHFFNVLTSFF